MDASGSMLGPVSISATAGDVFEAEDQLAVAPNGTIAIAWTATENLAPYATLAYRFSTDGGASFSAIGRLVLPVGLTASDPGIAADAAGNFYVSVLGVHFTGQTADYTRVFVAQATSGTTTFASPVEVTDPSQMLIYDHPKIIVTAKGTIALGFMETPSMTAGPVTGMIATSTDGQTWHLATIVGSPEVQFANLFWFCEGSGILYTTYVEQAQTSPYIAMRWSLDEGATWSTTSTVVSQANEAPAFLDPGCVASGTDVWVVYATTMSPSADPMNVLDSAQAIRVAHVADRGATVDATRKDALDPAGGSLGLLPVLVREGSGALDVAYLSGNSEGDSNGSVRYARASGAAFGSSVQVDGPMLFTMSRTSRTWLGDYMGAVTYGNNLLAAYPMNARGRTHIYFRSVPLP
jgi:hypothetical protein